MNRRNDKPWLTPFAALAVVVALGFVLFGRVALEACPPGNSTRPMGSTRVDARPVSPDPVDERAPQAVPRQSAWLGIRVEDGQQSGARIAEVLPGSPAAEAGLRPGDVIIRIDETEISASQTLIRDIGARDAGSKVSVTILRGEKEQTLTVTLGQRPADLYDGFDDAPGLPPATVDLDRRRSPYRHPYDSWRPTYPPYPRYRYYYLPPQPPFRPYGSYYYYYQAPPGVYVRPYYYQYYGWPPRYSYWYYGM